MHTTQASTAKTRSSNSWSFAPGLKGVETDANDHDLLVASVTGQTVMVSRGVKVDPNFVQLQVDLSTGNIKLDGAIHINGDMTWRAGPPSPRRCTRASCWTSKPSAPT